MSPASEITGRSVDRREFIAVGAGLAASVAVLACEGGFDASALGRPDLVAALGPDVVRRLGRRYRESVPSESDAHQLEAAIRASQPWTARIGVRYQHIAEQVRDDFDAGRTVVVDGWLLSLTEARQCGLYSALHS